MKKNALKEHLSRIGKLSHKKMKARDPKKYKRMQSEKAKKRWEKERVKRAEKDREMYEDKGYLT